MNVLANQDLAKWIAVILIGLITFGYRLSFILFSDRLKIPLTLQRALRFVPIAALTAIIMPEVLLHSGKLDISFGNVRLLAAMVAIAVAWQTKNVLWTIVSGMCVLWVLQWVLV